MAQPIVHFLTQFFSFIGFKIEGSGSEFFGFNDQGDFVLKKELDFETRAKHVIKLVAFNPNGSPPGSSAKRDLTILVDDINEAPVFERFIGSKPPPMENEPSEIGNKAGRVVFNDDSDNLSYELIDEAGFFSIDQSGNVIVASQIDREWACSLGKAGAGQGHPVLIRVTDSCTAAQRQSDPACAPKTTEAQVFVSFYATF